MKTTPLLYAAVALVLAACSSERDNCPNCAQAATSKVAKIQPWDAFGDKFEGCAGGCGIRLAGPKEGVIMQPGAFVGQHTYCPVSGVAFEIKSTSPSHRVGDKLLYFCCDMCAGFFLSNRAAILEARGISV